MSNEGNETNETAHPAHQPLLAALALLGVVLVALRYWHRDRACRWWWCGTRHADGHPPYGRIDAELERA